jgi:hypothetical protein
MNAIPLAPFTELAGVGHHLAIVDDDNGDVCLYAAEQTFKGRLLSVLSYIPLLRDLQVVVDHCDQLQIENAQALGVFMQALAGRYGDKAAERALMLNEVNYSGHTPLDARVVSRVIKTAEALTAVKHTSQAIGFQNLGNTCYANTALKVLIASMGQDVLADHLHHFVDTSKNEQRVDAAQKFLALLDAYALGNTTAGPELRTFFNSLQPLEEFSGDHFQIIGVQNDAREFLGKLMNIFGLDTQPGYTMGLRRIQAPGSDEGPGEAQVSVFQLVGASKPDLTMQDIVNHICTPMPESAPDNDKANTNAKPEASYEWTTQDLSSLKRLTIHIEALALDARNRSFKVHLSNPKLTDNVFIVVNDEKTNQKWRAELEPREVIVQDGSAAGGHYYAYTNQGFDKWTLHDDHRVKDCDNGIPAGKQPTMISYALKQAVLWKEENAGATPEQLSPSDFPPRLHA